MAAEALVTYVARSSATMVLPMQNKQVLVFHKEGFQSPAPSQCWERYQMLICIHVFLENFTRHNIKLTHDPPCGLMWCIYQWVSAKET